MNFVIIQKVRTSRKIFQSNTYKKEAQGEQRGQGQIGTSKRQKTMKSTESQLHVVIGYYIIFGPYATYLHKICLWAVCKIKYPS